MTNLRCAIAAMVLVASSAAHAEVVTLRFATLAPDGTAWAREVRAFAREISAGTHGAVDVKWYLGGIAGDEVRALERVRLGQLDGLGGSSFCERLAPSLLVTHVIGLFRTREEVAYVLGSLKALFDDEFRKSGFEELATSVFGIEMLFSRHPVRTMADFRAQRWWTWSSHNIDPLWQITMPELGARAVPATLDDLPLLYQRGAIDGFVAVPSVALGFQWSPMASYFSELHTASVPACAVLSHAALDALPLEHQQVIRDAGAKLRGRWDEVTATLDRQLVEGLFEKQGLKKIAVSQELRDEFFAASKAARGKLDAKLVPRALLEKVEKLLATYRAQHGTGK